MITNEQMKERVEKGFELLGTRTPTMEEYGEYLFPDRKSD